MGQFDKAMTDFNKAIALDPWNAKAYINRGGIFGEMGRLDEAIKDFDEAIVLDPSFGGAFYCRGLAYSLMGNYEQASYNFRRACNLGEKEACRQLLTLNSQ